MRKLFYYHFFVVVVNCHWFYNKESYYFIWKKYIKSHSVKYWEPDWLFRFTIVFQLNNGKNIWSSLKMQWQLSHLTNDCIVWPCERPNNDTECIQQCISFALASVSKLHVAIRPGHAKMCLMAYANNKGADKPAHPRSLISTFVIRCLDDMICILALLIVSRF